MSLSPLLRRVISASFFFGFFLTARGFPGFPSPSLSAYAQQQTVFETGSLAPSLSVRLAFDWKGEGGGVPPRSAWGERRLRPGRWKLFPEARAVVWPTGGSLADSGPVANISPAITVRSSFRLPPMGRAAIFAWSTFEKHSVLSGTPIVDFSQPLSPEKNPGRWTPQEDPTWVEYDVGDGGAVVAHSRGELGVVKGNPIWGPGYAGQLQFSDKAPSFLHVFLAHQISPRFRFTFLHGALNSGLRDSSRAVQFPEAPLPLVKKYVAAHRLDFWPTENLRLGAGESVIYGGRGVEGGYLLPILFYWSVQHDLLDSDNLQMFVEAEVALHRAARLYAALFLDEWDFVNTLKSPEETWAAYQAGGSARLPFLGSWGGLFRFEYTRVPPTVYVHRNPVNTFDHHRAPIGFWTGPNADHFFVSVEGKMGSGVWCQVYVRKTRAGEVTEETIARQYRHERVPFLFRSYDGEPETRRSIGIKGETEVSSWLSLSWDVYRETWNQKRPAAGGVRQNFQRTDARLALVAGL